MPYTSQHPRILAAQAKTMSLKHQRRVRTHETIRMLSRAGRARCSQERSMINGEAVPVLLGVYLRCY